MGGLGLLLSWVILLAAWLLAHVAAVVAVLGSGTAPRSAKLWSLVPPATPVVAWRQGARPQAVAWGLFAALYLLARLFG